MNTAADSSENSGLKLTPGILIAIVIIFAFACWLRWYDPLHDGLWLDEIYSASYTNLSMWETIVASLRFDIHPPFYYLQLDLWSIFGHSDTWLLLNTMVWSLLTMLLLFVAMRRYGTIAVLFTLAFDACLGSEMYFGHELRMYAMFNTLALLGWMLADKFRVSYRFKSGIPLILVMLLMSGLHSASLIAISALMLYIFPYENRQFRKDRLVTWLSIAAIVGLAMIPWLVNAMMRKVGQTGPASFTTVIHTVTGWFAGYGIAPIPVWTQALISLAAFATLIAAAITIPRLSRLVICFIFWPVLFAAVICMVKPIWYYRAFTFCAPFLSIVAGLLAGKIGTATATKKRVAQISGGLLVMFAVLGSMIWFDLVQLATPRKNQYQAIARYLDDHVQPGQLVYIPDYGAFWGMAHYLVGPQWGNPLEIQDPFNQDRSEKWPRIYAKLGPSRMQALHLTPKTRLLDGFKVPVYVGWSPLAEIEATREFWVVGPYLTPFTFELDSVTTCAPRHVELIPFRWLRLYHIQCLSP